MQLRPLGSSQLSVSRIGLGLAALGRPGYINLGHADDLGHDYDVAHMEARAHAVLDAAWTEGIRYFDAARSYGRAEAFLASWLATRRIDPAAVTVGSKWGYTYTADWRTDADHHEVKDHSLATFERQIAESRALLGAQLDLYQIHSATLDSGALDNRALLEALARLRRGGLAIGLTVSGPQQAETVRRALALTVDGTRLFDCVQATWNILEQSVGPALEEAHARGVGVIIKEPLANGRLTPRNTDPEFAAPRRTLERTGAQLGITLDALALAAVCAQPWADVVLSGAATVEHLRSNLAALAVTWNAAAELAGLCEEPQAYWARRSRLAWN